MAAIKTLSRSFAGGEITPELSDRVDLGQYQTGLAKCENAIVYPHGVVSKRGGTRFVGYAKNWWKGDEEQTLGRAVRLIPFQFSATQSYVMELGHHYLRIHAEGGTVLVNADVIAESITSEGVDTGTPNKIVIKSTSHGLSDGAQIKLTVTPEAVTGQKIGSVTVESGNTVVRLLDNTQLYFDATAQLPVADGINKNDYFEVVDSCNLNGRPVNAGYLLRANKSDPYVIAKSTTASISGGGVMTNTEHLSGAYAVGMYLFGTGVPSGKKITNLNGGTGFTSGETYNTNYSGSAISATTITGRGIDGGLWDVIPKEDWSGFVDMLRTVTVIDEYSFAIDYDSSLTSPASPSTAFNNITRKKEGVVEFPVNHGYSNDDLIYITLNTPASGGYYDFDQNAVYKVADATLKTFKIKKEVVINGDDETAEWQYVNTKGMMKTVKKKNGVKTKPSGFVSAVQYKRDIDVASAVYSAVTYCTGVDTTLTLYGHGFYSGQTVWYSPDDKSPFPREDYYSVKVLTANTFELYEIGYGFDTRIDVCDGVVSAVYEIETPYDESDVSGIDFAQSYDVLTLTHKKYPPSKIERRPSGLFDFVSEWFLPRVEIPTGLSAVIGGNLGTAKRGIFYYVTSIRNGEESFPAQLERPARNVLLLKKMSYSPVPIPVNYKWMNNGSGRVGIAAKITGGLLEYGAPIRLDVQDGESDDTIEAFEGTHSNSNMYSVVARMTGGWYILKRRNGEAFDWSPYINTPLAVGFLNAYVNGSVSVDFTTAGKPASVTLSWNSNAGTEYNVYKRVGGTSGDTPGFIGRSKGGFFTDDNILPDMSITPPAGEDPFDEEGNYPSSVDYYQQRKIYSGTVARPQTTWMSRIGTENNMMQSLPVRDDDSINFRLAGREQNAIKFMIALQNLVLFSENAEWVVSSVSGAALTPSTIAVMQQSSVGCADVKPVVSGNSILFVQAGSNRVMQMEYNFNAQAYSPEDVSMLAFHLFENHHIVSMVIERGIFPVLWCVRDDGVLLGLTYAPKQNVIAWHRHDVGGEVKWATSTKEQSGVAVYLAVSRDGVMCIERMDNYSNWRDRSYFDALKTTTISRDSIAPPPGEN
mgnify:CR=1 FL=1